MTGGPGSRGDGAAPDRAERGAGPYGTNSTSIPFEKLKPLPQGPAGSRYQAWKFQVSPAAMQPVGGKDEQEVLTSPGPRLSTPPAPEDCTP